MVRLIVDVLLRRKNGGSTFDVERMRSPPAHRVRADPGLYVAFECVVEIYRPKNSCRDSERNNPTELALRPISIGRKNLMSADAVGEMLVLTMTVIETGKLSDLSHEAKLAEFLTRIRGRDPAKLDDLLPWNWTAFIQAA